MIATHKAKLGRRAAAALIHEMDKDRSKWGLGVLLLCLTFWLILFRLLGVFS